MDANTGLFNRQFLLTKERCDTLGWTSVQVAEYHLYIHPNLELTTISNESVELILLGYIFDYRQPGYTNRDILKSLLTFASFEDLLRATDEFSGRFVLIYRSQHVLRLFHDACGQREVFYDTTFSAFGSQPKLIEYVIRGEEWTDRDTVEFFQSEVFLERRIFVGDITHRANIKRLTPNHYADIWTRSILRFFPDLPLVRATIDVVAVKAIDMVKGYLKSASMRYALDIAVTAGYDSRLLFLASLDLQCTYYVIKNYGPGSDKDVEYARIIAKTYNKSIEVRDWDAKEVAEGIQEVHEGSIDFSRPRQMKHAPSGNLSINGLLAEIYKNFYETEAFVKSAKVALQSGFSGSRYVAERFEAWRQKNEILLKPSGYSYLDLLYWEDRAANWVAKEKTEAGLYVESYSPFSSRAFLILMLSTDRKYRDKHFHKLYDVIIYKMSPRALKIPINPASRNTRKGRIKMMKRLGIYEFDQKYGIISKILRHLPFS